MACWRSMDIKEIPNFLSSQELIKINQYFSGPVWQYGGVSTQEYKSYKKIWNTDLRDDKYLSVICFNRIKEHIEETVTIGDLYANGQTYGMSGSIHKDNSDYTLLIYSNLHWNLDWGGRTVFISKDGEQKSFSPIPGLAILSKGNIDHYSDEISRECYELRTTIVYKLNISI